MRGRRSQRTYAVRAGSERWAFVPHPEISGWWFRCHISVLVAACPHCKSPQGHPCRDDDVGYKTATHYYRRDAAAKAVADVEFALGVVANIEQPKRKRA
jgi:hypothetical protein